MGPPRYLNRLKVAATPMHGPPPGWCYRLAARTPTLDFQHDLATMGRKTACKPVRWRIFVMVTPQGRGTGTLLAAQDIRFIVPHRTMFSRWARSLSGVEGCDGRQPRDGDDGTRDQADSDTSRW